jgi:acetylornithine/N-succinyldiaminopimelate aminotransferase
MSTNQAWIDRAGEALLGNYRPAPVVIAEGRGCRVTDVEGRTYLDLCAGLAVISVGHSHPKLTAAIAEQAGRLLHVSNLFYNPRAIELAEALRARTGYDRFFFCNSGTEANEALIKLSRRYHYQNGDKKRDKIISAWGSFHGRTIGALTLTGEPKYQEGMAPLMGAVEYVKYNDLEALKAAVDQTTAAVILEPIQGEGGIVVAEPGYLEGARRICDQAGVLLLFDEVQTGYGRTGRFLAREWSGVTPDAFSLAKGIGGGFPLGAMGVSNQLISALPPGSHASTFGGNALACAAGLAVLSIFDEEGLVANAERVGAHLGRRLSEVAADPTIPAAAGARGRGLLRGLALAKGVDPSATLAKIRDAGVLLSIAGGVVLRFSPPLCVTATEVDEAVDAVIAALKGA